MYNPDVDSDEDEIALEEKTKRPSDPSLEGADRNISWDATRSIYIWESPDDAQIYVWNVNSNSWILDQSVDDLDNDFVLDKEVGEADNNNKASTNLERKKKKRKRAVSPCVYATGLPVDATFEELYEFFKKAGVIAKDSLNAMKPKIKLYLDENDKPKGDALVTYLMPLSVENAFTLLDEADFRPPHKYIVKLSLPDFSSNGKKGGPRPPRQRLTKKQKKYDQRAEELGWEEKDQRHVIIKYVFDPREANHIDFYSNLEKEIRGEFEKIGEVELFKIFERSPEGVVAVKYKYTWSAEQCIQIMGGRFFAERKLEAFYYDGYTNYFVEETDEEKEAREKEWSKWLLGNDASTESVDEKDEKEETKESQLKREGSST